MVFYAEDYITMNMELLLQGLYRAAQDDNPRVEEKVCSGTVYSHVTCRMQYIVIFMKHRITQFLLSYSSQCDFIVIYSPY